jgi:hypothetical protein
MKRGRVEIYCTGPSPDSDYYCMLNSDDTGLAGLLSRPDNPMESFFTNEADRDGSFPVVNVQMHNCCGLYDK